MVDMPKRIVAEDDEGTWVDKNIYDSWGILEMESGEAEYVRADMIDTIRQQALADALMAVEGVRMNSTSSETALINFGVDTAKSAIRRLMVENKDSSNE